MRQKKSLNRYKWIQMGLNRFILIQIGLNRSQKIKYDMLWPNMALNSPNFYNNKNHPKLFGITRSPGIVPIWPFHVSK